MSLSHLEAAVADVLSKVTTLEAERTKLLELLDDALYVLGGYSAAIEGKPNKAMTLIADIERGLGRRP